MFFKRLPSLSFLVLAGVALATDPQPPNNASGRGISTCNCTDSEQTGLTVNHTGTVAVTHTNASFGNIGNHSTGLTGAAQSGAHLAPKKCLYVHYMFACDQVASTWVCVLQSWHVDEREADSKDCD